MKDFLKNCLNEKKDLAVVEKWSNLGFTAGVENKRLEVAMAEWFENVANYFLENEDKIKELTDGKVIDSEQLSVVAFPIIRRILTTMEYIQSLRNDQELFLKEIVNYWEENKEFINTEHENIDIEAELCSGFIAKNVNFPKLMNKK